MSRYESERGVLDGFQDTILPFVWRFSIILRLSILRHERTTIWSI